MQKFMNDNQNKAVQQHPSFAAGIRSKMQYIKHNIMPQHRIGIGFFIYIVLGWLCLCIPLAQKAAVPWLDNLFTAASALSTTGLTTVSVMDSYTFFGQFIILILMQVGGIGYMTFSSFVLLSGHRLLSRESERVLSAEFALPNGFDLKVFLKSVIIFTFVVELLGAIALFAAFKYAGISTLFSIWSGIFHSVSAFCTAGFGLYSNSFEGFIAYPLITKIISILTMLGCFGFIPITDIINNITGKVKGISFTTRVIVFVFTFFVILGTGVVFFTQPSVRIMPFDQGLLAAFFQAVNAMTTAGFNNISLANLSAPALLVLMLLMYIGAAPSGTGGGIKSTTFVSVLAVISSRLHNRHRVSFFGKAIPLHRIYSAISTFIFYAVILFTVVFLLSFTENLTLAQIMFEATSALGTVGLSTGITGQLTAMGKIIIICTMFIGRLGVLTFGLLLFAKKYPKEQVAKKVDIAV